MDIGTITLRMILILPSYPLSPTAETDAGLETHRWPTALSL